MPWIDVAARADVPTGGTLEVEAGDLAVLLYDLAGVIHATSAICPHHAAFLAQGGISGDCVDCPRHMGRFHIPTGRLVRGPDCPDLRVYPVDVSGERVRLLTGSVVVGSSRDEDDLVGREHPATTPTKL